MTAEGSFALGVPAELIEAIARRTAEIVRDSFEQSGEGDNGNLPRYLDTNGTLEYLGWGRRGRSKLYSLTSAQAIPFVKHGQRLFFDRFELDAWVDKHRLGPAKSHGDEKIRGGEDPFERLEKPAKISA